MYGVPPPRGVSVRMLRKPCSLLFCGVGIVQLNLLFDITW